MTDDRSYRVDRPVRMRHGLGYFCTVCIARGESASTYEFDDRESLIEHWQDEHY